MDHHGSFLMSIRIISYYKRVKGKHDWLKQNMLKKYLAILIPDIQIHQKADCKVLECPRQSPCCILDFHMQRHVRLGGQFEPLPIRCIRCFMGLHHPLVGQPVKRKKKCVSSGGWVLYCLSIFNSFSCNKSWTWGCVKTDKSLCADDTDLPTIWIFQTYLDQHVSIKLSEFMGWTPKSLIWYVRSKV